MPEPRLTDKEIRQLRKILHNQFGLAQQAPPPTIPPERIAEIAREKRGKEERDERRKDPRRITLEPT